MGIPSEKNGVSPVNHEDVVPDSENWLAKIGFSAGRPHSHDVANWFSYIWLNEPGGGIDITPFSQIGALEIMEFGPVSFFYGRKLPWATPGMEGLIAMHLHVNIILYFTYTHIYIYTHIYTHRILFHDK